jgi:tetratricopeptide (TPR) repeat protein
MNNKRLSKLLDFQKQNPDDPFILYGIALEYSGEAPEEALKFFNILLNDHPDYLPTYYHAAALLAELEMTDKAEEVYKKGIALAEKEDDQHALKELKNAYLNFMYE